MRSTSDRVAVVYATKGMVRWNSVRAAVIGSSPPFHTGGFIRILVTVRFLAFVDQRCRIVPRACGSPELLELQNRVEPLVAVYCCIQHNV